MKYIIFLLFLLFWIYYVINSNIKEHWTGGEVFDSKKYQQYYKLNNIIYDPKNKNLTKCNKKYKINYCKTINYAGKNSLLTLNTTTSKVKTSILLEQFGIPVPKFISIDKYYYPISKNKLEYLLKKRNIQKPYVIKRDDGNQGRGVYVDIKTSDELLKYMKLLFNSTKTSRIIIEEYKKGEAHRILMHRNKIIDIVMKERTKVIGNGKNNIKQLIQIANINKKKNGTSIIDQYEIDYINSQGYELESIIPPMKQVILSKAPHYHHGSPVVRIDFKKSVHPDNIIMFHRIQEIIGSELLGIDYISKDISKSWKEMGWINEINSKHPDLNLHQIAKKPKIDFKKRFINTLFT